MRAFSTLTSLFALSSLLVLPGLAHAEKTCKAESDCAKGWTCHDSHASDCAVPSCPPGQACESAPVDCETYKSCQPAPCQADSDCAADMVCYTFNSFSCPASDCAPGQDCSKSDCTSTTQSACAPRYVLPCTTASDCGSGFRCEATEDCACSSGGSAPSGNGASAGSAATPEQPSCICSQSKEKSCHTDPVTCTADSDCLTGWTCATFTTSSPCIRTTPASGGAGAQGGAAPDAECPAPTETKQCVPPYYALIGDNRGISHDSLGDTPSASGETASGAAIPPTANSGDNQANHGDSRVVGCTVTPGARTTGSALALFGVLGLFSALRRRRAR